MSVLDTLFQSAFKSANTAIFDVGSIMAVLVLAFGLLDYHYGEKIRILIEKRRLDRPWLATMLALIPVDGTLLFLYEAYRRGSLRFGSLFAGVIGIGEEATYMVLSFQPLYWLIIAGIKLVIGAIGGGILNQISKKGGRLSELPAKDHTASINEKIVAADANFHELPDKYRHRLHHFRYHSLGIAFWIFFGSLFALSTLIHAADRYMGVSEDAIKALSIPLVDWLAVICLIVTAGYVVISRLTTQEFGKIFSHEFEDAGDAAGDLAESCAEIILLIFAISFIVESTTALIGVDTLAAFFSGKGLLAVAAGACIGLIPGTGSTLAFTAIFFALNGTPGHLPFAALLASSIALIGDSQFIGARSIRYSQRLAHVLAFLVALVVGTLFYLLFPGM